MADNKNKRSDNRGDVIYSKKTASEADIREIFVNRANNRLSYKVAIGDIQILTTQAELDLAIAGVTSAYRVYTALLTQSGVGDPTAVVLENTLGATITYVYIEPGVYLVSSSIGLFTSPNEHVIISGSHGLPDLVMLQAFPFNDDQAIIASTLNGTLDDNIMGTSFAGPTLFPCVFEIKIYN